MEEQLRAMVAEYGVSGVLLALGCVFEEAADAGESLPEQPKTLPGQMVSPRQLREAAYYLASDIWE